VIPLDLAGHVAHNLFHLLAEGRSILLNATALVGYHVTGSAAVASPETIQLLQFTTLGLGIAGSLFAAFRIAPGAERQDHRTAGPPPAADGAGVFGAINVYLFTLPMSHGV